MCDVHPFVISVVSGIYFRFFFCGDAGAVVLFKVARAIGIKTLSGGTSLSST